jgi:hypothetical protein
MQVNYWNVSVYPIVSWDIRPSSWPAIGRPYAANCLCSAPGPVRRPLGTAMREVTGRQACYQG